MKKKLAVIIMAFIMMISGCSMALSQGEYYNRFSENYKAYNKNLLSLSAKLGDAESDPGSVDWDSFESDLKGARDSLDAIEKLSPPPIYSAQHRNICEDIQSEREWCEAVAKVAEDRELTDDMLQEIARRSLFVTVSYIGIQSDNADEKRWGFNELNAEYCRLHSGKLTA